jgi:Cof subfamily protein (haloacid dehalogenase superfamily)
VPVTDLLPGGRADAWAGRAPTFVGLDVDGTLLAGAPVPTPRVLAALRALVAADVRVGVATGRPFGAVQRLIEAAGLTGPHVAHNGAAVLDGDGALLRAWSIQPDAVDALIRFGAGRDDLLVEIYTADAYRPSRDHPLSNIHTDLLGLPPAGLIRSAADLGDEPAVRAVVIATTAAAERDAMAVGRELGLATGASSAPTLTGIRFVNVTDGATDKGIGVAAAAGTLGIDLAQVAAIGDEHNDIPLLGRVGTGIAMGDAAAEVRAAAHLVAPTFAEDGAAVALDALRGLVDAGR